MSNNLLNAIKMYHDTLEQQENPPLEKEKNINKKKEKKKDK